jgi:hypothetical protein
MALSAFIQEAHMGYAIAQALRVLIALLVFFWLFLGHQ